MRHTIKQPVNPYLPSYEYIRKTVQKEIQQGVLYISKKNPNLNIITSVKKFTDENKNNWFNEIRGE